jgi:glycosyltransferase involved in cell wall biosynthesis
MSDVIGGDFQEHPGNRLRRPSGLATGSETAHLTSNSLNLPRVEGLPETDADLVSVVIPAYNAAATLDETLQSVRSQTHRALEIIVVDDGSTDDTRAIAERHAAVDNRVQVFTQDNAGVAAARNAGWRRARSHLIAFVDADDLWAPTKIERQIDTLRRRGQNVGLVYCGSVRINMEGVVTGRWKVPGCEGHVLDRLFVTNVVGNGSAVLVRRQALIDAKGFNSELRTAGAEGCEDYLLCCRIAETYQFAVVDEHLVGYRHLPRSMSSNRPRMLKSWMLVVNEMLARHPEHSDALRRGLRDYGARLVHDALDASELSQLPRLLLVLLPCAPWTAMKLLLKHVPRAVIGKLCDQERGPRSAKAETMSAETAQRFLAGR